MTWLAAQIHSGIHNDQPQRSNHQLQRCNSPTFPLSTGCVDHFVLQLLVQSHAMRRSHQISRSIPLFTVCCDINEPRKVLLISFVLYSATSQAITPCNMSNASNITFVSAEHVSSGIDLHHQMITTPIATAKDQFPATFTQRQGIPCTSTMCTNITDTMA